MYDKLNYNIENNEYEDESTTNAWYLDICRFTTDILEAFNEDDWSKLFRELPGKSITWKRRLSDCLTNPSDPNQLKLILYFLDLNDKELFMDLVGVFIDLDIKDNEALQKMYEKAAIIKPLVNGSDRKNIDVLLKRMKE